MSRGVWSLLVLVVAAVVLVAAGVALHVSGAQEVSLGWFAYEPVEDVGSLFPDSVIIWGRRQVAGAGVVVLGLLAAAAALGYVAGHRGRTGPGE